MWSNRSTGYMVCLRCYMYYVYTVYPQHHKLVWRTGGVPRLLFTSWLTGNIKSSHNLSIYVCLYESN